MYRRREEKKITNQLIYWSKNWANLSNEKRKDCNFWALEHTNSPWRVYNIPQVQESTQSIMHERFPVAIETGCDLWQGVRVFYTHFEKRRGEKKNQPNQPAVTFPPNLLIVLKKAKGKGRAFILFHFLRFYFISFFSEGIDLFLLKFKTLKGNWKIKRH